MLVDRLRNLNYRTSLAYMAALVLLSVFFLYSAPFDSTSIDGKRYLHTADDHMITMRVAKNFADYGVPFFNKDESVAANSSLFWPLILGATVMTLTAFNAVASTILVSVLLSASTIAIAILWFKEWWLRLSAITLLAGSASYLHYGASGWEHIPQAFFVTFGMYLIYKASLDKLRIPTIAVFLISFSFIFRPDSAVIIAVTVLAWISQDNNYRRWQTYAYGLLLLALPISYLILMSYYYDSFSPNTAKLKILDFQQSLEFGIKYLINPFKSGLAPFLLFILFLIRSKSHFSRFVFYLGCAHVAYILLVGGDVFSGGRFFILLLPALVFVTLSEIQRFCVSQNIKSIKTSLLSTVVLVSIFGNYDTVWDGAFRSPQDDYFYSDEVQQIRVLHAVNERLEANDGSVGMHFLGVSYHIPKFHVVDFLGKAEPHIADTPPKYGPIGHNRWDYEYAFETYNIAVVPIEDQMVRRVSSPQFTLKVRYWMFWEECVQLMLNSDTYVYLSSDYFGNKTWGAFVRKDLVEKFQ